MRKTSQYLLRGALLATALGVAVGSVVMSKHLGKRFHLVSPLAAATTQIIFTQYPVTFNSAGTLQENYWDPCSAGTGNGNKVPSRIVAKHNIKNAPTYDGTKVNQNVCWDGTSGSSSTCYSPDMTATPRTSVNSLACGGLGGNLVQFQSAVSTNGDTGVHGYFAHPWAYIHSLDSEDVTRFSTTQPTPGDRQPIGSATCAAGSASTVKFGRCYTITKVDTSDGSIVREYYANQSQITSANCGGAPGAAGVCSEYTVDQFSNVN